VQKEGGCSGRWLAKRAFRRKSVTIITATPLAQAVRAGTSIKSIAVGLILDPLMANAIIADERADLVAIGRGALEDPNWPLNARRALRAGGTPFEGWPKQYGVWHEQRERVLDRLRSSTALGELAPMIVEDIFDKIKQRTQALVLTVFMVEQIAELALEFASYGYCLESGRVLLEGEASELLNNVAINELHLGIGKGASPESGRQHFHN
jgi:hypothetical protein